MDRPYAFKELADDGEWRIKFAEKRKMSGTFYSSVHGCISEEEADLIVRLLNEHHLKSAEPPIYG